MSNTEQAVHEQNQMQTWVHLPMLSKANLLTLGCAEGSAVFITGAKQGVW